MSNRRTRSLGIPTTFSPRTAKSSGDIRIASPVRTGSRPGGDLQWSVRGAFRDRVLRAIFNVRSEDRADTGPLIGRRSEILPPRVPCGGAVRVQVCAGMKGDWLVAAGEEGRRPAVVGRCGGLGRLGGYSERPARIGFLFVGYRAGGTDWWRQTRFVVAGGRTRIRLCTGGGASTAATSAHVNPGPFARFTYGKVDSMSITCRLRATLGRRGCTGWPVGPFDDYLWIDGKIWGEGVHGATTTTWWRRRRIRSASTTRRATDAGPPASASRAISRTR